jgi:hypothetical protein
MIVPQETMVPKSVDVDEAGHGRHSAVNHRSPNWTHNVSKVVVELQIEAFSTDFSGSHQESTVCKPEGLTTLIREPHGFPVFKYLG